MILISKTHNVNVILDDAWKTAGPPFHDDTIMSADPISVALLSRVLRSIAGYIRQRCASMELEIGEDWHAHDGFRTDGQPISFDKFLALVSSNDALRKRSPGDSYVFLAVYPKTHDFLLRFRVIPADELQEEDPAVAEFSFTGYGIDIFEIKKRLMNFPTLKYSMLPSEEYFRTTYAG